MNKHLFQPFDYTYDISKGCKIVNVFFPQDCENNCPFCTTKSWYKDTNIDKWWISLIKVMTSEPDIVIITGGEPLSNHQLLKEVVFLIRKLGKDNLELYINTSPTEEMIDHGLFPFINENFNGLNFSAHNFNMTDTLLRYFIYNLNIPIRINYVLPENVDLQFVEDIIEHFYNYVMAIRNHGYDTTLVLREDYRNITRENLFDFNTPVLNFLTEKYELVSHQYCHFCCNFNFRTLSKLKIRYHRGTNNTSAKIGSLTEHMELILAPNGEIYTDWDMSKEGLDELIKKRKSK